MLARTFTSVINVYQAIPVSVEAKVRAAERENEARFEIIGLADTSIREAKYRVSSALRAIGVKVPKNVLINLSPAELKKDGAAFDLPIAAALIRATGKCDLPVNNCAYYGELALDGTIKPVRGMIAHAIAAKAKGWKRIFLPYENLSEVSIIQGIEKIPLKTLQDLILFQRGELDLSSLRENSVPNIQLKAPVVFADIYGQHQAKRALMISAVGKHNLLFVGPPGCGKSMLAQRFPVLLDSLTEEERLQTAAVYSISGLSCDRILSGERPYRHPHHSITDAGLIGGGSIPRPGEISLAHNGVLFMDEFPEFRRSVLETLRAPLENRKLTLSRAKYSQEFPADFQLIAAMNPCPCGKLGTQQGVCSCGSQVVSRYLQKLSAPILDRIDLQVSLQAVDLQQMQVEINQEARDRDHEVLTMVREARTRFQKRGHLPNALLDNQKLLKIAAMKPEAERFLDHYAGKRNLSARAYFRVLKVALSIMDLRAGEHLIIDDLAEALSFRSLDLIRDYAN